jgi:tetratricopeptide (TPR) repeat protein
VAYVAHEAHKSRAALHDGREHLQRREYSPARAAFQRGLAGAENLPLHGDLTEELRAELRLLQRVELALELHAFVERVRGLYGADGQPAADVQAVEARCRDFWQTRATIVKELGAASAPEHEQVRIDLLDLAILWTDLRVRLADESEANAVHREALDVLAEAEELFGPSCVLASETRTHATAIGMNGAGPPDAPGPRTGWEHYAAGRAHLRANRLDAAAEQFERALALHPQAFWPNFDKGRCAYQRGCHEDAVLAFTACVVLAPDSACSFYNRGLAYDALGHLDRAICDCDRSLQLDPALVPARALAERLRRQNK